MTDAPIIRWMVHRDLPEVLEIDHASFPEGSWWTEDDFTAVLRQRNCMGMVAESAVVERALGFMLYRLDKNSIELLSLAVAPDARRRGVGAVLIARMKDKLSPSGRKRLNVRVTESNLGGQLFFADCGLRAVRVERGAYDDGQDAYVFRYGTDPLEPLSREHEALG